jgi:hypothetical protein
MKKILLSTVLASTLFVFESFAQDLNLNSGWQLKGTESGLTTDDLNRSCIDIVWKYSNSSWEAYSPNSATQDLISNANITSIESINKDEGFWIYANESCDITTSSSSSDLCVVETEYFQTGDSVESANTISENIWYTNSLNSSNRYFYRVNVESDAEFIFMTSGESDTYGTLYSSTNEKVAWDDESGEGSNFMFKTLLTAGTYYLEVKGFSDRKDFKVKYLQNASYFTGRVIDSSSNPLSSAVITLTLPEENITTTTDENGNYSFKVEGTIPSTIALTASLTSYSNSAVNIYTTDKNEFSNNFVLSEGSSNVIEIDNALHHLGDDTYSGNVNSQFQAITEGIEYIKEFEVDNLFLQNGQVTLELFVKGSQDSTNEGFPNTISLNDVVVGSLGDSPVDGSFEKISVNFPISYLNEGSNSIKIISVEGNTYDDFEFTTIKVTANAIDISSNLLAYFPLTTDLNDISGNNVLITDNSSETIENSSGYTFNANSELIVENQMNFKNSFTVTANVTQNSIATGGGYLFAKHTADDSIRYASLFLDDYIKFFYTDENGVRETLQWDISIANGEEREVALVVEYPYVTLYLDGASQGKLKMASKMIAGESDIVIGKRFPDNYDLDGSMSELRFYDRALTKSEVLKLYE